MENNLRQNILEECFAMVRHLSSYGKEIPSGSSVLLNSKIEKIDSIEISDSELIKLHRALSKKVAPAHPKSLWLICKESYKSKWLKFLGPVGLVRRMMFTAIVSLILFILISMSEEINYDTIKEGIFNLSGLVLLKVMFFYLTSASLGASFSSLFQANRYIMNNTFDPQFETSYWIRYILGIIAGIMLALVIPVPDKAGIGGTQMAIISRPMLAMLGGFSAALVYRILFRMVYAVESIFIGKQSEETERKLASLQSSNELEKENERQQYVNMLLQLQSQVNQGKSSEEIEGELKKMISDMTT